MFKDDSKSDGWRKNKKYLSQGENTQYIYHILQRCLQGQHLNNEFMKQLCYANNEIPKYLLALLGQLQINSHFVIIVLFSTAHPRHEELQYSLCIYLFPASESVFFVVVEVHSRYTQHSIASTCSASATSLSLRRQMCSAYIPARHCTCWTGQCLS